MKAPRFKQTTVSIATKDGPRDVPAVVNALVPGLAATSSNFGLFEVTHIGSGLKMPGGVHERAGRAMLLLAEYGAIGHAYGIDYTQPGPAVIEALKALDAKPVPFDGATVTSGDGTRPQTVFEFIQFINNWIVGDEFPWEAPADDPMEQAGRILDTFTPAEAA